MAAPDAVPAGRRGLARTLGWLALANGLLAALIGLRTLALYDVPMALLPLVYTGLAYLAHYATLGLLALLPAFLLTLLWPRWLPVRAVAAVAGALLLAALVVDGNVFA
jgi:membrane-anchored protein YejM (alkaline phosphatase superfamily)